MTRDVPPIALPLIVFSDLDGTLLDHHSYDWSPAIPAMQALREIGGGLVLASSKTGAELSHLRAEMGWEDFPAIVENGAGLLEPGAMPETDGGDYAQIRAALDALPTDLRAFYTGFGDMDVDGVVAATGLAPEAASLARARVFSEPGTWVGDDAGLSDFLAALAGHGISARRGGRFLTLSMGRTKADATNEVLARYRPATSMGLGDAPNDVEMLQTCDIGIIITNPDAPPLPPQEGEDTGRIRRSTQPGPIGWNSEVNRVIEQLMNTKG